jgi:hypothetical protein
MVSGQPLRISAKLADHLQAVVSALVFAKAS